MEWSPGLEPEPLDSDFVRQLKAKMAAEGWNQTELAAAAGVSPGRPSQWLRGQGHCRNEAEVLRRLGLLPSESASAQPLESAQPLDSDFVRQLKAKMAAEGWNQAELAAAAGVSPGRLSRWPLLALRISKSMNLCFSGG
jgi:transcriptional regulator with XRE-family HTH domain